MIQDTDMPELPQADIAGDRKQPLYYSVAKTRTIQREAYKAGMAKQAALIAECSAVFKLMHKGCREKSFGDYQNGDGETIGPRMDALEKRIIAATKGE